jgi:hypothetical protein
LVLDSGSPVVHNCAGDKAGNQAQRDPENYAHQHGASPLQNGAFEKQKKADAAESRGFGIQLRRLTH